MAKIAFVLGDDFEDSEFKVPYDRIREAGHKVTVVGAKANKEVKGKKGKETFTPEAGPGDVNADQFDALVIPGGYSPDKLRTNDGVVSLVQKIFGADKPVAAICHAGSLLIEADAVRGRRGLPPARLRAGRWRIRARWSRLSRRGRARRCAGGSAGRGRPRGAGRGRGRSG